MYFSNNKCFFYAITESIKALFVQVHSHTSYNHDSLTVIAIVVLVINVAMRKDCREDLRTVRSSVVHTSTYT